MIHEPGKHRKKPRSILDCPWTLPTSMHQIIGHHPCVQMPLSMDTSFLAFSRPPSRRQCTNTGGGKVLPRTTFSQDCCHIVWPVQSLTKRDRCCRSLPPHACIQCPEQSRDQVFRTRQRDTMLQHEVSKVTQRLLS